MCSVFILVRLSSATYSILHIAYGEFIYLKIEDFGGRLLVPDDLDM